MTWLRYALPGLLALVAVFVTLSWLRRRAVEDLRQRLAGREIIRSDRGANFFGVESKGQGQIRGNGVLVLTPGQLVFEMLLPRREMVIDLRRISRLAKVKSHLHKSVMRPLLRVEYEDGAGGTDAVAWSVKDVEGWISELAAVCDCEVEGV